MTKDTEGLRRYTLKTIEKEFGGEMWERLEPLMKEKLEAYTHEDLLKLVRSVKSTNKNLTNK